MDRVGRSTLLWDQGPWAASGRINYIHHFNEYLQAGSFFTQQDPRFQTGTFPTKVPSYTTFDLFGRYNFTPNLSVSASVLNVTDEVPPYEPIFLDGVVPYDFTQYDIRGRTFRIGVNYKFR